MSENAPAKDAEAQAAQADTDAAQESDNQNESSAKDQGPARATLKGFMGYKSGMSQMFTEDGVKLPVTIIDLQPQYVTQVKTNETDGYTAAQIGLDPIKSQRAKKPQIGHAKKTGHPGFKYYKEFSFDGDAPEVGQEVSIEIFQPGQRVDVKSKSKGKGFQGGMKRWNFGGLCASHGVSVSHRALGSTGNHTYPGRTFKGKKMAGQMGNKTTTAQYVEVISVDAENRMLVLKGSVPGGKNSVLEIRPSVKGRC